VLVLTRKTNESIFIDGGIEVIIIRVHSDKVRIGIRAPLAVSIRRTERADQTEPRTEGDLPREAVAGRGLNEAG
jgi:carbon storage regulator CsrA